MCVFFAPVRLCNAGQLDQAAGDVPRALAGNGIRHRLILRNELGGAQAHDRSGQIHITRRADAEDRRVEREAGARREVHAAIEIDLANAIGSVEPIGASRLRAVSETLSKAPALIASAETSALP